MPTEQFAYPIKQDAFAVGQPAKSRYASDTGVVQTAVIAFGGPVQRAGDGGIAPFASGGTFLGIARRDQGRPVSNGGDQLAVGAVAAYFTSGHVAVLADKAVALDAAVNFNTATGRYTDAATSGTVLACTGWTFDSITTAAGQIVVVRR